MTIIGILEPKRLVPLAWLRLRQGFSFRGELRPYIVALVP